VNSEEALRLQSMLNDLAKMPSKDSAQVLDLLGAEARTALDEFVLTASTVAYSARLQSLINAAKAGTADGVTRATADYLQEAPVQPPLTFQAPLPYAETQGLGHRLLKFVGWKGR